MKSLFTQRDTDAAIGTTSAASTSFRMKFYTKLPESDKWEFSNECAEILMKRFWDNPLEKFDEESNRGFP
jgi:hypothetical protein